MLAQAGTEILPRLQTEEMESVCSSLLFPGAEGDPLIGPGLAVAELEWSGSGWLSLTPLQPCSCFGGDLAPYQTQQKVLLLRQDALVLPA